MRRAIRSVSSWRAAFGLFLLTLSVLLALRFVFPETAAQPIEGPVATSPVLMFEFARTPADLAAVFGPANDPLSARRIAAMDQGNRADFALMLAYGLFLLSFFAAVAREKGQRAWLVFGGMGIAAALADGVENALLLSITADMAAPSAELAVLFLAVWTKFALLALCCAGACALFLRQKRFVLALLCLPAVVPILPAIVAPPAFGALAANAIGLGWLAMGIHAARQVPDAL